jgi:hypothetical protein
MYQHFVEGLPWEETECFTNLYRHRFRPDDSKNGALQYADRLRRYRTTVDMVFESLKKEGFRTDCDLPVVLVGRSGDIMLGNQGNHRVAMAKILGIEMIPCEVVVRHSAWTRLRAARLDPNHPDRIIA